MPSTLRAKLKYPIGSSWRIKAGLPHPYGKLAGYPATVMRHEFDKHGGVTQIGIEVFDGFQWWAVETCDDLLEPVH